MKKIVVLILGLFLFSSVCLAAGAADQSVVKIGSDVKVEKGEAVKDAVSIGGSVIIRGTVSGNAVSVGGTVTLRPTAKVLGDAVSVGGNVVREEGAVVSGNIVQISPIEIVPITAGVKEVSAAWGIAAIALMKVVVFISFLILAWIFTAMFSKKIGAVSASVEGKWLKSFLYGLIGYILVCPVILLLLLSIIGIALIPIFVILLVWGMIIGYIAVAQLLGKKITLMFRKPNKPMMLEVTLGMILLGLLSLIPVLGSMINAIVYIFGLGGFIVVKCCTKA